MHNEAQKLKVLNSQLNTLVNIYIDNSDDDKLLLEYINFAKDITEFENGFISFVNDQNYKVIQSSTLNNKLAKGAEFRLCDTLCQEVIEKEDIVYHSKLKGLPQYDLAGRIFLDTQSVIGLPLFIDNKIWGTFTLCSTSEKSTSHFENNKSILQLIALKVSRVINDIELKQQIQSRESVLQMGERFSKTATYKRFLGTNEVICTDSFYTIFDIDIEKTSPKETFAIAISKVMDEDRETVIEKSILSTQENVPPFEYRITSSNHSIKWLRHQLNLTKDEGYVLGVIQDITELKNNEISIKRKNEELEQLAYASAHDLQEPLRTITGFIDLINRDYADKIDKSGKTYLSFITNASYRMKEQIDGLLDHSRIGRNITKEKVDTFLLVKNIIKDLDKVISDTNAQIEIPELPIVDGYKVELRLLFLNLITNAIKFTTKDRSPEISISFEEQRSFWKFHVKDNGIGMKKEYIPNIFKLFGRLNHRSEYSGTGIGLTQAKKVVDLHQGEIFVNSQEGVGTTFSFTIKK